MLPTDARHVTQRKAVHGVETRDESSDEVGGPLFTLKLPPSLSLCVSRLVDIPITKTSRVTHTLSGTDAAALLCSLQAGSQLARLLARKFAPPSDAITTRDIEHFCPVKAPQWAYARICKCLNIPSLLSGPSVGRAACLAMQGWRDPRSGLLSTLWAHRLRVDMLERPCLEGHHA